MSIDLSLLSAEQRRLWEAYEAMQRPGNGLDQWEFNYEFAKEFATQARSLLEEIARLRGTLTACLNWARESDPDEPAQRCLYEIEIISAKAFTQDGTLWRSTDEIKWSGGTSTSPSMTDVKDDSKDEAKALERKP